MRTVTDMDPHCDIGLNLRRKLAVAKFRRSLQAPISGLDIIRSKAFIDIIFIKTSFLLSDYRLKHVMLNIPVNISYYI